MRLWYQDFLHGVLMNCQNCQLKQMWVQSGCMVLSDLLRIFFFFFSSLSFSLLHSNDSFSWQMLFCMCLTLVSKWLDSRNQGVECHQWRIDWRWRDIQSSLTVIFMYKIDKIGPGTVLGHTREERFCFCFFESNEKCEPMYEMITVGWAGWLYVMAKTLTLQFFLKCYKCDKCQTLHKEKDTTHWALSVKNFNNAIFSGTINVINQNIKLCIRMLLTEHYLLKTLILQFFQVL